MSSLILYYWQYKDLETGPYAHTGSKLPVWPTYAPFSAPLSSTISVLSFAWRTIRINASMSLSLIFNYDRKYSRASTVSLLSLDRKSDIVSLVLKNSISGSVIITGFSV